MGCWRGSARARARPWLSAVKRVSARPRCCVTPPARRLVSGLSRSPASRPRWSSPFAGVHQLLAAMPDRLDAIPAPQGEALTVALGMARRRGAGAVPRGPGRCSACCPRLRRSGRSCASSTTRNGWMLLRRRSSASSRDGSAPSRWRSLLAVREPAGRHDFDGLPELRLEGLPDHDAGALLASVVTGRLDSHIADRIVAETRGNPLALLELPPA